MVDYCNTQAQQDKEQNHSIEVDELAQLLKSVENDELCELDSDLIFVEPSFPDESLITP